MTRGRTFPKPGEVNRQFGIEHPFGLPIVGSKLVTPLLPASFVERPRVVDALSERSTVICFVQAAAGYGKTTAVVEALAKEDAGVVAWLSIDAYDSTELRFWVHLAASIDLVCPGVLRLIVDSNQQTPDPGGVQLPASLLAALPSDKDLLIVFDDLHHVKSRALWEQLAFFLERLPTSVRVVATTRSVTPLPLERWRSQSRVRVIDEQILRFDTTEAAGLIAGVSQQDVTTSEVAELVERSEGWAVGLVFEALTRDMASDSDDTRSTRSPRPTRTVVNYLATEVLDTLSADDRDFLLSISVLDEFDNDLCRQVTGEAAAGLRLRSLQVANLFLVPVGDEPGRFRFHHLFRELLLEELDRRDPGRSIELHRRAAEAMGTRGDVPIQIHHLLEAGDRIEAFDLMVSHAFQMGDLATAQGLIASFPQEFVHEDPVRILDFAQLLIYYGDWEMSEQWRDRVEATLTDETGPLRARLELHHAMRAGGYGDAEAALGALDRSFVAGIRDDDNLAALAVTTVVRVHVFLTRDRKAASEWIEEARQLPSKFAIAHQAAIPTFSGFLRFWDGDTHEAERLGRQGLAAVDRMHTKLGVNSLEALLGLIDVLIETADLSEAVCLLERAKTLAGQMTLPGYLVHVALRQIEVDAATHGPAAGADAAANARAKFTKQRLGAIFTDALTAKHVWWLLAEGRTTEASQLAGTLAPSPSRSILMARLDSLDHRVESAAGFLRDTQDWAATERLEAELILDAANGYGALPKILERYDGFVWTVVKQGPALIRRLTSYTPETNAAVARVLDRATTFNAAFRPAEVAGAGGRLTNREQAILRLLPSHLSYAEIAAELHLSVNTVKGNLKALYRKLGASSRSEAVQRAHLKSRTDWG
jgi:LuxR family maltose regulon positive regulatory protein